MMPADNSIVFRTERLAVRPYTMDDLDYVCSLNGNPEIMQYIRPAQTPEQSREFLQKVISAYSEQPGIGRWGMFSIPSGEFVGSFAIIPVENTGELQLGYALLKEHWGKGYASESVRGGINYAFDDLDLTEIAGITFPANISSQKVLLKNGFIFNKTFMEGDKELFYYLLRKENI
jgi:RimJ/RimL family protein N-acetyltransferase